MPNKFPYEWTLKDGYKTPSSGLKVFGTFICGGGSTMGYKLAGFEHLGGVEIDPKIADVYKANHNPKYLYVEDIREFNKREDLPKELFNLDLLDGSPPCSSFSMAGSREKAWGKSKRFREGQAEQTLDDLVFEYVKTIKKLQPKVALLENVKGLIQGNAKVYAKALKHAFELAGYAVQVFLLNSASMGVPQRRERVFFIGLRNDIKKPLLQLRFDEPIIVFGKIKPGVMNEEIYRIRPSHKSYIKICKPGKNLASVHPKGHYFNSQKQSSSKVSPTIVADSGGGIIVHHGGERYLTWDEYKQIGSFPMDYNFMGVNPKYLIGMSVPPVMTAQIATKIKEQWF